MEEPNLRLYRVEDIPLQKCKQKRTVFDVQHEVLFLLLPIYVLLYLVDQLVLHLETKYLFFL